MDEKWCLGCHLCEYYCAFANSGKRDMVTALKDAMLYPRIQVEGDNQSSLAVGCYTCILTCPYGAITLDAEAGVQKCELCASRADGMPACVQGCPNRALKWEERA